MAVVACAPLLLRLSSVECGLGPLPPEEDDAPAAWTRRFPPPSLPRAGPPLAPADSPSSDSSCDDDSDADGDCDQGGDSQLPAFFYDQCDLCLVASRGPANMTCRVCGATFCHGCTTAGTVLFRCGRDDCSTAGCVMCRDGRRCDAHCGATLDVPVPPCVFARRLGVAGSHPRDPAED